MTGLGNFQDVHVFFFLYASNLCNFFTPILFHLGLYFNGTINE